MSGGATSGELNRKEEEEESLELKATAGSEAPAVEKEVIVLDGGLRQDLFDPSLEGEDPVVEDADDLGISVVEFALGGGGVGAASSKSTLENFVLSVLLCDAVDVEARWREAVDDDVAVLAVDPATEAMGASFEFAAERASSGFLEAGFLAHEQAGVGSDRPDVDPVADFLEGTPLLRRGEAVQLVRVFVVDEVHGVAVDGAFRRDDGLGLGRRRR
eukprot:CAMPEP_0118892670 /NCGR_PEP_ID=MMETSP1166-20130328/2177_1 /TAXON_ID=1104430 /ORGANISM="Chrysoreinhardia sp, Strain CCMP3193" /LENGTH=215 /DNA_ID=CAMNT_0006831415 /DNA_START=162 /DNA_END=808 /DNA_ORIENTATION=+